MANEIKGQYVVVDFLGGDNTLNTASIIGVYDSRDEADAACDHTATICRGFTKRYAVDFRATTYRTWAVGDVVYDPCIRLESGCGAMVDAE